MRETTLIFCALLALNTLAEETQGPSTVLVKNDFGWQIWPEGLHCILHETRGLHYRAPQTDRFVAALTVFGRDRNGLDNWSIVNR